jgi:hypothetical protein
MNPFKDDKSLHVHGRSMYQANKIFNGLVCGIVKYN